MGWAELRERLRQHVRARADALRYRVGLEFPDDVGPSSRQPARFFFAPDDVPSLCSQLKQRFPAQADEIVRRAEQICSHRFDLLGYQNLYYGQQIDWHLDRVQAFLRSYREAGGPCKAEEYLAFIPFIRWRLRQELRCHFALVAHGLPGEPEYAARQLRAFERLRDCHVSFA